ncbi:MAG: hypothetical protein JXA95_12215 [Spirochaetales bacterium]|nr:hypothetical protein [Spirochaetales bacterium]
MKKVLLVSPYPFSHSSRGMDVLTRCFDEEGWDTHHLVYPRVFYTPRVAPPRNTRVTCHWARKSWFPYIDRLMSWMPPFLFRLVRKLNNRTLRTFDFTAYDYIVLESGKPLFLMDIIPPSVPLIYRLSDSVRYVLGKNPSYIALEDEIYDRGARLIFKKAVYLDFLTPEQREKATVIENGMVLPPELDRAPSFPEGTKNTVYVGLHRLDAPTLETVLIDHPDCSFHIIGPCLSKGTVKKLGRYGNFRYYPFLSKEEYMPLLRDADLAVFPFVRNESMKWFGLTSKFLHFMYFRLPIVSYPTGFPGEFDNLPVVFAENREDFSRLVGNILGKGEKIDYPIDFDYYSRESRDREYKRFIGTLA